MHRQVLTLLGMMTGTPSFMRTMVFIGSTDSTTPATTSPPPEPSSRTESPTTNGCVRNCGRTKGSTHESACLGVHGNHGSVTLFDAEGRHTSDQFIEGVSA